MDKKRALALGFFDGVHAAHKTVLALARAYADEAGIPAAAVTFDRSPAAFIRGTSDELICTLDERIELLKTEGGMDEVIVLPFDTEMMGTDAADFVKNTLFDQLGAAYIAAGFDYRFGAKGAGDADLLRTLCAERGIGCAIAEQVSICDEKIASTAIRAAIAQGDMSRVCAMLGRTFRFSGVVQHGKALGRTLGFPTMNIPMPDGLVRPAPGVYICRTRLRGVWHASVCNISEVRLCEAFMLAHNEDAYGACVEVELYEFLRPMRKMTSLDELREQVDIDKKTARDWFITRVNCLF